VEPEWLSTGLPRLDQVLGGGFVPHTLTLFAGHAGAGKSSLMTRISGQVIAANKKVLYISAEESAEQFKLRAMRFKLPASTDNLLITTDATLTQVEKHALAIKPDLLIIDSIQSLRESSEKLKEIRLENIRSSRVLMAAVMALKAQLSTAIILIGHETKNREISGAYSVQHLVDVVLKLDRNESTGQRVLTVKKNRFADISIKYAFSITPNGELDDSPPHIVPYRKPPDVI